MIELGWLRFGFEWRRSFQLTKAFSIYSVDTDLAFIAAFTTLAA
jgi:hypothetical protein